MSSLEPILELEWRRESRSGQVGTPLRVGLQQLATLSDQGGFGCQVFLVPAFDRHFEAYAHADLHERVIEAAEAHRGLTVVDLLEGFADQEVEAVELSEDGLHPNRKGHEILATLVHRHLEPVVTGVKREGRSR
jgi:lysophospholipase L1-like esterase